MARRFDTPIAIERRADGVDQVGQPLDVWEPVYPQCWADVRFQSGMESMRADAPSSSVRASMSIRYLDGIDAGMRVVDLTTGFVYEIESVPPQGRRQYLDMVCVRHGA